uniref:Ubiquitin-related modifier 1 n=1 Tax=Amphilophus citrinellus TaxID=61819 RepID=A0A3Q0RCS8_AMPCI
MAASIAIHLEFGGGAELLFDGVKQHRVTLPSQSEPCDLCCLWEIHLTENGVFSHRRPGILVLINDADWELMGELDYQLQDRDNIVFISTLHGG